MNDAGWGATMIDPDKMIKDYAKSVSVLCRKAEKLTAEIAALVAAHPIGEMLKCKDIGLQAKLQLELRTLDEVCEALKSPANNAYEAVRKQVLPPIMEDQNVDTIKIRGVGRVDLRSDIYANTIKGGLTKLPPLDENRKPIIGPLDKDGLPTRENWEYGDLHDWLGQLNATDLITETVNASSLKALLRAKMKDGIEIPAELIKVVPYTYAAITKG